MSHPAFLYPARPVLVRDLDGLASRMDLEEWLVQPKWAGERMIMSIGKGSVACWSRHRRPLARASGWDWLGDLMGSEQGPTLVDGQLLPDGKTYRYWDMPVFKGIRLYAGELSEGLAEYDERNSFSMGWEFGENGLTMEESHCYSGESYADLLEELRGNPHVEGLVFKRRDARDMWSAERASVKASQLKWRAR